MPAVLKPPARLKATNVAELVDGFGGIPLERIRVQPPLGTATIDDLIEFNGRKQGLCELVDGSLVYKDITVDAVETEEAPETLAQLMYRLNDIPLERVRLQPAPGTATVDDAIRHPLCELIEGTLVEKALSYFESRLAMILVWALETFLEQHPLGYVVGPDAQTFVRSDKIRIPDVSFVRWERTPDHRVSRDPVGKIAPDLAVEILSASNTPAEMAAKRRELFRAGTRCMWVFDPATEMVDVYTSPTEYRRLTNTEILDGQDVLPGFRLSIREWIDRASAGHARPAESD